MAEILLCVKDRGTGRDPVWDARAPKAGDVIAVVPDGHGWGSLELGGHKWGEVAHHNAHQNPHNLQLGDRYYIDEATRHAKPIKHHRNGNHDFFRVIKFPNCTVAQLETLTAPEVNSDSRRPSPFLQFRSHFIDKSKLPADAMKAFHDHWQDDERDAQHLTLTCNWAQVQAVISQRQPVPF